VCLVVSKVHSKHHTDTSGPAHVLQYVFCLLLQYVFGLINVCSGTCVNFFTSCNVQLKDQCKFANGTGPSDTCTGDASTLGVAFYVLALSLFAAAFML
jgi:hypothetical protein